MFKEFILILSLPPQLRLADGNGAAFHVAPFQGNEDGVDDVRGQAEAVRSDVDALARLQGDHGALVDLFQTDVHHFLQEGLQLNLELVPHAEGEDRHG